MSEANDLLTAARRAAGACAAYLREEWQRPRGGYEEKSPGDLVSEVDFASQAIAKECLMEETPEAGFLAEEGEDSRPSGAHSEGRITWIVDPVDGTANFLHRFPMFSVSIAAARGEKILAAAVTNPATGERFEAALGEGATLDGRRIEVSGETRLDRSLLATGWPFRRHELLEGYFDVLKRVLGASQGMRRPGAASLDLAYTAAGRLDGYWEFGLKLWDVAAGALIVTEAGGRVSDFGGGSEGWYSGDIVATNGAIHDALLAAVAVPEGLKGLLRGIAD